MNNNKILIGALVGITAGAILGILFAPEKGSRSRKIIRTKSSDYLDEFKHKYNHVIDLLTSKLDHVSHEPLSANQMFLQNSDEKSTVPNQPKL